MSPYEEVGAASHSFELTAIFFEMRFFATIELPRDQAVFHYPG